MLCWVSASVVGCGEWTCLSMSVILKLSSLAGGWLSTERYSDVSVCVGTEEAAANALYSCGWPVLMSGDGLWPGSLSCHSDEGLELSEIGGGTSYVCLPSGEVLPASANGDARSVPDPVMSFCDLFGSVYSASALNLL